MGWEVFIFRVMDIICGHNFQFWPTKLQLVQNVSFIWYTTWHCQRNFHFCDNGGQRGHIYGHSEVNWPPIDLKFWQANYLSPYLSFDISLDISNETFIFGASEVIWGRIFDHSEAKWTTIDLKYWQVNFWRRFSFIWYVADIGYEHYITLLLHLFL